MEAGELGRFFTVYNLAFLGEAVAATFALAAFGCLVGSGAGFGLALARRTRSRAALPLRLLAGAYVEVFRRVPFLVTLLLVFFASQAAGLDWSQFTVALVSVGLIAAAYLAEIIRGGLASVHPTQWDAAAVMNLPGHLTLREVVLPQAWRVILPPAFGYLVLFIKDTALASQIGVLELTYAGKVLNDRGFPALLTFGSVLVLYFALSYPLARLGAFLELRLASARHHRT